ncbi:PIN domain-containing protein [Bifidobacterium lemurum]|uniref:PIN domain-containing protein n=1 Tax=Bifidobacterium lemurum TaxID=1603886 RepID=A0A261FRF6_9BIFI|nr:PIN domain-containing protein [Bifidobacterium lemurum]OZG61770.1 PIN domain-containing protein [Bifidobacterium lemurum]QOL34924.1 hypothetical protein BL8807_03275 [Bifidobacterium lemurum]
MRVFVDANILYSKTIRDWLFAFSTCDIKPFDLYSSEDVFAETVYHLRRNNPTISGDRVAAALSQMRELVTIVPSYNCEEEQSRYLGADANDLHLHAATVASDCDVLLTNDSKIYANLNEDERSQLPYSIYTADEFFVALAETSAVLLDQAVTCELNYWSRRFADGVTDLETPLLNAGCANFAFLTKRALMRKSGLSPIRINDMLPLDERYSKELRANAVADLELMSDDFC